MFIGLCKLSYLDRLANIDWEYLIAQVLYGLRQGEIMKFWQDIVHVHTTLLEIICRTVFFLHLGLSVDYVRQLYGSCHKCYSAVIVYLMSYSVKGYNTFV